MKKHLPTILTIATILIIVGAFFFLPHDVLAQAAKPPTDVSTSPSNGTVSLFGISVNFINSILANVANFFLGVSAWAVAICGTFLSISINLTTHIQEIFFANGGSTSSIQTVWIVVRDISSIFIIFTLLYCSIETILGRAKSSINSLIAKIFLAGILINFSLFFVKVAVDASNLVSLQFYNAIAPQTSTNFTSTSAYYDGGLSNIFMQSLRLPTVYNNGTLKGTDVMTSIAFAAVGGVIMMWVAAFSFLAAALAFTARTAIILFVMALSPFYFAGMIFPKIEGKVSKPLMELFLSQLLFMPAYLFLLYVALKLISDPTFMAIFQSKPTGGVTEGTFGSMTIGVILQYTIAIIFINAPLVAAIMLGGKGMKWAPDMHTVAGRVGGFFGRNTIGRASRKLGESFDTMAANGTFMGSSSLFKYGAPIARLTRVSQGIRSGLAKGEKGKFGGTQNLDDIKKEDKARKTEVEGIARSQRQDDTFDSILGKKGVNATDEQKTEFAKVVGKMSKKEVGDMDYDKLSNALFLERLSSKQFDTLIEGDTLTEDQKEEVKKIRKDKLEKTLTDGNADVAKEIVKNLSGKEMSKFDKNVLRKAEVINQLTSEKLKEIDKEMGGGTDEVETRRLIATYIRGLTITDRHPAWGYMQKAENARNWGVVVQQQGRRRGGGRQANPPAPPNPNNPTP